MPRIRRMTHVEIEHLKQKLEEGLSYCRRCDEFRPVERFNKGPKENFGYRYYCKDCEREDYLRQKANGTANVDIKKKNRELKTQFVELAGGKCQKCGFKESVSALDFHHIDPNTKENYNIVYRLPYDQAYKEIDKCCLLCKNCHQMYTAMEWRCRFVKREGLGWTVEPGSIEIGEYWMPEDVSIDVSLW